MYNYTIGIVFSFIYAVFVMWSTFAKNKKQMGKIQFYDQAFGAFSNFFLTSYSAVIINGINAVRNYLVYKGKINKIIIIICIVFYISFGIMFNSKGWIGIFPIIASSSYAVFCLKSKDEIVLKYGLILNQLLWLVHDIYVMAVPAIVVEIIVTVLSIYNIKTSKKKLGGRKNVRRRKTA